MESVIENLAEHSAEPSHEPADSGEYKCTLPLESLMEMLFSSPFASTRENSDEGSKLITNEDLGSLMGLIGKMPEGKTKKRLLKLNKREFFTYKFRLLISQCCRTLNLSTAVQAYRKAKSVNNFHIPNETYLNLLSLTAGLGDQGKFPSDIIISTTKTIVF